jgi:hypothetical protein
VPCRRASTPSSPFLRSSGAVVQHLGDPPAVVHVEGRVGDAGQRPLLVDSWTSLRTCILIVNWSNNNNSIHIR